MVFNTSLSPLSTTEIIKQKVYVIVAFFKVKNTNNVFFLDMLYSFFSFVSFDIF